MALVSMYDLSMLIWLNEIGCDGCNTIRIKLIWIKPEKYASYSHHGQCEHPPCAGDI